jgi:hypothetical protein
MMPRRRATVDRTGPRPLGWRDGLRVFLLGVAAAALADHTGSSAVAGRALRTVLFAVALVLLATLARRLWCRLARRRRP